MLGRFTRPDSLLEWVGLVSGGLELSGIYPRATRLRRSAF